MRIGDDSARGTWQQSDRINEVTRMELYVGGMAQGKLSYVREKKKDKELFVVNGAECGKEELMSADLVHQFHLYIKRGVEENENLYALIEELEEKNPNVILICDEVGAGIVPMKREDREYREMVGRICCTVAKKATRVERIVCGVGVRLK